MPNQSLLKLLQQQFPTANIDFNDDTLRIGSFAEWDSLGHFHYLLLIEETYDTRFDIEEMSELKTLSDIEKALKSKGVILE